MDKFDEALINFQSISEQMQNSLDELERKYMEEWKRITKANDTIYKVSLEKAGIEFSNENVSKLAKMLRASQ